MSFNSHENFIKTWIFHTFGDRLKAELIELAMNLALHGFLLQVLLSILNLQHGSLLCSAGEPGYLDFDNLPETNFSCQGKVIGGYYADVEVGCQMFHVCTIGQKDEIMDIKFLCLNGTVFDQETRVCERVDEVDCSKSERFYNLNLELYGNNAVTLSLHENNEDDVDQPDPTDDHQRTTSARPTTTTTSTTTSKPSKPSTTPASNSFSHPTGYPQHYQPQPPFPQVHTSQSKSLYDDKNGGYHHQYIFHNGERSNNQQATSYQLFSNQGVGSTTVQPPQVHQIRFSSTSNPQIIHNNEPSTVTPLFHATSSTIQTLLNSNGNGVINPIFHNHGIASTTEQFIHSNNPRETSQYREHGEHNIRPLEAIQSTNKGKISKLTISPVPTSESPRSGQTKTNSQSSQQQRISGSFLPTPATDETTIRSFYPTPRTSSKPPQTSQPTNEQVTQHIHVLPPIPIPQLKPHQITINLPPPDLQRIIQNPSSLLPSQSRVIVTAKASVSDESGRPLNTTQLVTLPLPTIPASYDDYKEGDESFDPFYRDVPKIRNSRRVRTVVNEGKSGWRVKRSKNSMVSFAYDEDSRKKQDREEVASSSGKNVENESDTKDFRSFKESLMRFRDILFGDEFTEEAIRNVFEGSRLQGIGSDKNIEGKDSELEDLETKASKNFKAREYEDDIEEEEQDERDKSDEQSQEFDIPLRSDSKESDGEEYIDVDEGGTIESDLKEDSEEMDEEEEQEISNEKGKINDESGRDKIEVKKPERIIDVVILDPKEYSKSKDAQTFSNTTEREHVSTEIPKLFTTEETSIKMERESIHRQDSKNSKDQRDIVEDKTQSKEVESDREENVEDERRREKLKESKPIAGRKSSRIRSRGKVSSRKKENKTENNESVKSTDDNLPEQNVETSTTRVNSEVEQIDKNIFEEPESQTSKEVDTRAVNDHGGYLKSLQTGKDQDSGKENRKGEVNDYETSEKQSKTLETYEEEFKKILEDEENVNFDEAQIEEKKETEETKFDEEMEQKPETLKKNSSIERESVEDESTTVLNDEDFEEDSYEVTKNSREEKNTKKLENSSEEDFSHEPKDENTKIESEEEEGEKEYSTTKKEEINSQEDSIEHHDSTEAFYESTYEMDEDNDYRDSENSEDTTISSLEHTISEETPSAKEEILEERILSDQEESTEGVLKFTDELPKDRREDILESKKSSEIVDNTAHDYVDDNYEPDNYKERESSNSNSLSDEKSNKEMLADRKIEDTNEKIEEDVLETTTESEKNEGTENPEDFNMEKTDLLQTTTSTTTTTATTTTTTTTVRPTPPKLFKPISARKNYNYIPPTTTPNPVIIKPRISLLNPKPAKPPKSYNELAPKPVIRKLTLLTRKPTTMMAITTAMEDSLMETTEISTTESTIITNITDGNEENVLEDKLKFVNETEQRGNISAKSKDDQDSSPSEQKSPTNVKKEENFKNVKKEEKEEENFTPYPISRLSTTLASTTEKNLKEIESTSIESEKSNSSKSFTLVDVEILSTTALSTTFTSVESDYPEESSPTTQNPTTQDETSIASSTKFMDQNMTEISVTSSTPQIMTSSESSTTEHVEEMESTTIRPLSRKSASLKRRDGFNCLEKEMYRFYGDNRDCRLFHYCSPGFTSRQVLDFRFVCEEDTIFDEESQSCRHNVKNKKCLKRQW